MTHGLNSGTTLHDGTYRIEKVLGQGSFGITYLAAKKERVQTGGGMKEVEVKVAIKEFFMSEVNSRHVDGSSVEGSSGSVFTNYRKRFRKEAENLARLSHSKIVTVFDVFDQNNTTYYSMRYIEGVSLDKYISDRGGLSENEAISITLEVGGAVEYMHSRRMLHLDIKPNNIMRRTDGTYFLIDFGLSKQFSDSGAPETSTTIGLGTPGYAPIEQSTFRQDGAFPATLDVYALGATLFKMLTGKRPPEASTILNDGFPSGALRQAGVSGRIIKAVEKAMSPSKKNRFQSLSEMMTAIRPIADDKEKTVIGNVNQQTKDKQTYEKQSVSDWIYVNVIIAGIFVMAGSCSVYRQSAGLATSENTAIALPFVALALGLFIVYINKLKKSLMYIATIILSIATIVACVDPDHPEDLWFGVLVAVIEITVSAIVLYNKQ